MAEVEQSEPTEEMLRREAQIRNRAYQIWEQEGRPVGQHERHWLQAEAEMKRNALSSIVTRETQAVGQPRSQSGVKRGTKKTGTR